MAQTTVCARLRITPEHFVYPSSEICYFEHSSSGEVQRSSEISRTEAAGFPLFPVQSSSENDNITEALELTCDRVDMKHPRVTFESIRKRRAGVFRTVPLPPPLIEVMDRVHNVRERRGRGRSRFLWRWRRTQAWRHVREVMTQAGIQGPHATPKGLRHGFGVIAAQSHIPLPLIQQWMGHASLEVTASYLTVLPLDEYVWASRLWDRGEDTQNGTGAIVFGK